jgi:hypothetical protein
MGEKVHLASSNVRSQGVPYLLSNAVVIFYVGKRIQYINLLIAFVDDI